MVKGARGGSTMVYLFIFLNLFWRFEFERKRGREEKKEVSKVKGSARLIYISFLTGVQGRCGTVLETN